MTLSDLALLTIALVAAFGLRHYGRRLWAKWKHSQQHNCPPVATLTYEDREIYPLCEHQLDLLDINDLQTAWNVQLHIFAEDPT